MGELAASQKRRIEGLIERIGEYLNVRLAHAERVNPNLVLYTEDLRSQLLMNLNEVLAKGRSWGTDKMLTADVLCGDDLDKRYQLLTVTGQYTLMHEFVQKSEELGEIGEVLSVNTLGEMYGSIDSTAKLFVKLTQIWMWWDMPDAICVHCFHRQIRRIEKLREAQITETLTEHYRKAIPGFLNKEVDRDHMVGHEYRRMQRYLMEFDLHRRDDLSHQVIIKRDVSGDNVIDDMLVQVAQEIQMLHQLENSETLEEEVLQHFGQRMGADPHHLSREAISRWQSDLVERQKQDLLRAGKAGRALGKPYNHKLRQLEEMQRESESITLTLSAEALEFAERSGTDE